MGVNALFTAVSGLDANQAYLGVVGNNIANSNTVGFKSSNPIFENLVSQTLSGTSSSQEGLGTDVFSIQQQFTQGAMENTSNPLNMAVDGNGFFIVQAPNGSTYYTRNGTFSENAQGQIVDSTGQNIVQGYKLNPLTGVSSGQEGNISLNTAASAPQATTTADLTANLNSNISPQTGTHIAYPATGKPDNVFMGGYITDSPAAGTGNTAATAISVSGMVYNGPVTSGTQANEVPTSLLIGNGDGTTNSYGVSAYVVTGTGAGTYNYNTGAPSGAGYYDSTTNSYLPQNSTISSVILSTPLTSSVLANTAISQNTMEVASTSGMNNGNDIQINANGNKGTDAYQFLNTIANIVSPSTSSSAGTISLSNAMPASYDVKYSATPAGYSVMSGPPNDYYSTAINVYDSLGNALPMTVTFAPSSSATGDWNVYYSINGTAAQRESFTSISSSGTFSMPDVTFDGTGKITSGQSVTLNDTPGYVSSSPGPLPDSAKGLSIALNLDNISQYAAPSATTAFTQNGYATGTLTSFTVDQSGRISGQFSNGQTEYLYQVALADFIAPTGLTSEGNSLYAQTFASGQPAVGTANTGNFGYITDSALEQSNVNISSEFTNMIVAQNAYVANSKVLTTENSVLTALESSVQ